VWTWLIETLKNGMDFFHGVTGSYGLAIIILTVIIKVILLPFGFSQISMTQKMQAIQPELEELKKKYRNDPQKLQKKQLELWQKHGINPLAGCLPMLLQFPFLIAFFQVLYGFDYIGASQFLWIPDLSRPDPIYILPILAAATTYWQTRIASASSDPSQKSMMYIFPIMIGWFSTRYAAGLSVYWVVSNLFQIVQQYLMPKPKAGAAKGETG